MESTPQESLRRFALAVAGCSLLFSLVLFRLGKLAFSSELHSHLLLIPCISGYLIWIRRATFPCTGQRDPLLAALLAGLSAVAGAGYLLSFPFSGRDALSLGALSYVCLVAASVPWLLGRTALRQLAFPIAFLVFMVPLPHAAVESIETLLQHASAQTAAWLFPLTGIPVLQSGLVFTLPTITLRVAQECSGIRSTLVLFITSLLAGHLFLRWRSHQVLLVLATILLGILRNAFRVIVISWMCVEMGPEMIDSWMHRHGGPVFFILSLVPLFGLLLLCRRRELAAARQK